MKPNALTYPVTQAVLDALSRCENLVKAPQLRGLALGQRSPLEIVRLLGNLHCDNIRELVEGLDRLYLPAGEIRKKVLQQTNPFLLQGALAEFTVFGHLHGKVGRP